MWAWIFLPPIAVCCCSRERGILLIVSAGWWNLVPAVVDSQIAGIVILVRSIELQRGGFCVVQIKLAERNVKPTCTRASNGGIERSLVVASSRFDSGRRRAPSGFILELHLTHCVPKSGSKHLWPYFVRRTRNHWTNQYQRGARSSDKWLSGCSVLIVKQQRYKQHVGTIVQYPSTRSLTLMLTEDEL